MQLATEQQNATKTLPYDVATQLWTTAEAIAYLGAWLHEAPLDLIGVVHALRKAVRAQSGGRRDRNMV